jgi:uncharacterized protein YecE (DUF72 family)
MDSRDFLAHYSRIFGAVEMDTTFYGIPRAITTQSWGAVPQEGFKFCAKTPQTVTHEMKLEGASGYMAEFIEAMRPLGDKLGVILIQMPPSFDATRQPTLEAFIKELPRDVRFAIELRHPSWYSSNIAEFLTDYGVCWAAIEYPKIPREIHLTADFLYVRWIGQHGSYDHHNTELVDKTEELVWWKEHIQSYLNRVQAVFGFFNNDYAGFAAGTCNRFKELAGLPATPFTPPQQGKLF